MKKKLLYVHNADFSKPCANRVQVLNMCKAFNKIGEDVALLSFNCSKEIIKNKYGETANFNTISLKPSGNYLLRSLVLFLKFLKVKDNFDRIFSRDLIFSFLVSFFFKNKRLIYELHDASKGKLWFFLFRKTFKRLLSCVVISEGLKEELVKRKFDENKIVVLHDGVDIEKFDIKISKREARKKLGLPERKKIVTYSGTLKNWKGYETFLNSYNYLKIKDAVLYLAVGCSEKQIAELKKIYKKGILFLPFIENSKIPLFLKASDILVIPNSSKFEISVKYTSPLKLFEYMASKRPIIASDLPSIRKIVDETEVLFFKADDEKDLALKIERLIFNRSFGKKLVYNTFQKVKKFSWTNRAKEIVNQFKLPK